MCRMALCTGHPVKCHPPATQEASQKTVLRHLTLWCWCWSRAIHITSTPLMVTHIYTNLEWYTHKITNSLTKKKPYVHFFSSILYNMTRLKSISQFCPTKPLACQLKNKNKSIKDKHWMKWGHLNMHIHITMSLIITTLTYNQPSFFFVLLCI